MTEDELVEKMAWDEWTHDRKTRNLVIWEDALEIFKDHYRADARRRLAVARPIIEAEVLESLRPLIRLGKITEDDIAWAKESPKP